MTSKLYLSNKDLFLPIPFTNGYVLTRNGIIMDINGKPLRKFKHPNGYWVNLPLNTGRTLTIKLATLMSIVFKGSQLPWEWWTQIELYFKDSDCFNIAPENIAHQIYPEHFKCTFEGVDYKIIPNFTRYGLAENGVAYNRSSNKLIKGYFNVENYSVHQLTCDYTNKTAGVGRHRLLALCYKEYPKDMDSLEVNHINHTPGDDWLDNLEWITPTGNVRHGLNGGARASQCRAAMVYDLADKSFTKFQSCKEVERTLGISNGFVSKCLERNNYQIIHSRYRINQYVTTETYDEKHPMATTPLTVNDYMLQGKLHVEDLEGNCIWSGNDLKEFEEYFKTGRVVSNLGKGFKKGKQLLLGKKIYYTLQDYPRYYGGEL